MKFAILWDQSWKTLLFSYLMKKAKVTKYPQTPSISTNMAKIGLIQSPCILLQWIRPLYGDLGSKLKFEFFLIKEK